MDFIPSTTLGAVPDANGNPSFVARDLANGVVGTDVPPTFFNPVMNEVINLQSLFGATRNATNFKQMTAALVKAMSQMNWQSAPIANTSIAVPPWANWCDFIGTGGGGGSGASDATDSGGGGGAGTTMFGSYPVTGLQTLPYSIGLGGAAMPASPGSGAAAAFTASAGNPTTIGSGVDECIAPAGGGGATGTASDPNYGGGFGGGPATGPHVTWSVNGGDGTDGYGGPLYGGDGGESYWGGGGRGAKGGGRAGQAPGTGAGGAYDGVYVGAQGAAGLLLVRFRP